MTSQDTDKFGTGAAYTDFTVGTDRIEQSVFQLEH
jgi:hypothetical protein